MCACDVTLSLVCMEVVLWLSLFLYWLRRSRCSGRQKTPDAHFRAAPRAKHSARSTSGHTSATRTMSNRKTDKTQGRVHIMEQFWGVYMNDKELYCLKMRCSKCLYVTNTEKVKVFFVLNIFWAQILSQWPDVPVSWIQFHICHFWFSFRAEQFFWQILRLKHMSTFE